MLKIGTRDIVALWGGTKKIVRAYIGGKRVFGPARIYTVALLVDPAGDGTVSGGGTYPEGTQVTVSATPASGYRFVAWVDDGGSPGPDLGIVGLGEIGTAHIGGKGA